MSEQTNIPARLLAPMAIAPGWRDAMAREWQRWTLGSRPAAPARASASIEPSEVEGSGGLLRVINGTGVISVSGPLTNDSGEWAEFLAAIFGGTNYAAIWRALEMARASSQVQRILMRFGTPGGDADGCGTLGRYIFETRMVKPIRGHVDTLCASAGLWLASQCEDLTSVEEGELGSIGVRCSYVDFSKFDESQGIERGEIISTVSPGKRSIPIDDDVKGRVQARIDDLAELFVAAVARGRATDRDTVIQSFGAGDVMIASRALDAGLIDGVCDFNQALADFGAAPVTSTEARAAARSERKAITMNKPKASEDTQAKARCAKCDGELDGKKAYCGSCYDEHEEPDGDEEAKALVSAGLRGQTKGETRGKLVAFARSVLEATGATSAAAALAKVVDSATTGAQLAELREQIEKERASARADVVATGLTSALASGRVTLGRACKEVPLLLGASKSAARAALEAIPATLPLSEEDKAAGKKAQAGWTVPAVVKALSSVPISVEAAESVSEWLEAQNATALPAPAAQVPAGHPAANEAMNAARPTTAGQLPDVSFADEARKMRAEGKGSR